MAEIEIPARMIGVDYTCDICMKGKMRPHGSAVLMSDPPQFPHQCDNPECKIIVNLTERYPTVRYSLTVNADGNG